MNRIVNLPKDQISVLFDLWGVIEDEKNPIFEIKSIDWSFETNHIGVIEKSNIVRDLINKGLIKMSDGCIIFPKTTLDEINNFLFSL
jgi:hypothetical protein